MDQYERDLKRHCNSRMELAVFSGYFEKLAKASGVYEFSFLFKKKSSLWNGLSDRSLGFITGNAFLAALRCLLPLELNCVDHNALSARRRLCLSLKTQFIVGY